MEKMLISIYDFYYFIELEFIDSFISSELFEASDYLLFNLGVYNESEDSIKFKELIYVNKL